MSVTSIIISSLGIAGEILKKNPDYPQTLKEKHNQLQNDYENELKKKYQDRDDDKIMNLREEISNFMEDFHSELKK